MTYCGAPHFWVGPVVRKPDAPPVQNMMNSPHQRHLITLACWLCAGTAAAQTPAPATAPADDDVVVDAAAAPAATAAAPAPASAGASQVVTPSAATAAAASDTTAVASQAPAPPAPKAEKADVPPVELSGYVQLQYENHQDSVDQLRQGGTAYNQDRFLVKRARVEISRRYNYAGYFVELDGNTSSGPAFGLHRAEGSLFTSPGTSKAPPLAELTLGLQKLPFGAEAPESAKNRWFMERSTVSRAMFPSEVDVGARFSGGWKFLRYALGAFNGEPKGSKANAFQLQDPNANKDIVARFGAAAEASDSLSLAFGVSTLIGKGFSAGADATKSAVAWRDSNADGVVDPGELSGNPAAASTAAQTFERWALGADLQLSLKTGLGATRLFGEFTVANNLDRGIYVADPILTGADVRELGWVAGLTHELFNTYVVGLRYDHYDPNADFFDKRGGKLFPTAQAIDTLALLGGIAIKDRARIVFEYDIVKDHLARTSAGIPTDLANNSWTLRLQVLL